MTEWSRGFTTEAQKGTEEGRELTAQSRKALALTTDGRMQRMDSMSDSDASAEGDFHAEIRRISGELGLQCDPPCMLQEWGRINSDPDRALEFVEAFLKSGHAHPEVDVEFAELVCSSADYAMQEGCLPTEALARVEHWIELSWRRPGVREKLRLWARLGANSSPSDPYPFGVWVTKKYERISGDRLANLLLFRLYE